MQIDDIIAWVEKRGCKVVQPSEESKKLQPWVSNLFIFLGEERYIPWMIDVLELDQVRQTSYNLIFYDIQQRLYQLSENQLYVRCRSCKLALLCQKIEWRPEEKKQYLRQLQESMRLDGSIAHIRAWYEYEQLMNDTHEAFKPQYVFRIAKLGPDSRIIDACPFCMLKLSAETVEAYDDDVVKTL